MKKLKKNQINTFIAIIFICCLGIFSLFNSNQNISNDQNIPQNIVENEIKNVDNTTNVDIENSINNVAASFNMVGANNILDYSKVNKSEIVINNDVPYFENELTTEDFEQYSNLDNIGIGRAHVAFINVSKNTMPVEGTKRERLTYNPTGWNQVMYGKNNKDHLYERCHLIAWSLGNKNNFPQNLITGTSQMNKAMIPYENQIREWINEEYNKGNKYHVMYRVTPVYDGDNLLAKGVEIEAESVEVKNAVKFNRFLYNVQNNFKIDYKTGKAELLNNE